MRDQGVPLQEVARTFRLTPARVRLIEREAATEKAAAEMRSRLQKEFRRFDDMDRTWPVEDLLDMLWLITIGRVRLIAHLKEIQKAEMSLRGLMDLAITVMRDDDSVQVETPLLSIRGIGKYGFYSVIAELAETDLGPRCNEEWRTRLNLLRRHWKIPSWPPNPRHWNEG